MSKISLELNEIDNYEIIVVGDTKIESRNAKAKIINVPFEEEFYKPSFDVNSLRRALKAKSLRPFLYRTGAISLKKMLLQVTLVTINCALCMTM
ncbi:hypothetical protein ACWX0P_10455 [Vibrio mediterranei]